MYCTFLSVNIKTLFQHIYKYKAFGILHNYAFTIIMRTIKHNNDNDFGYVATRLDDHHSYIQNLIDALLKVLKSIRSAIY